MSAETANAGSGPPPLPNPDPGAFEPMDGEPTLTHTFDTLLKKPGSLLYELSQGEADTTMTVKT